MLWTRDLILKAAGFDVAADTRRALTATRGALDADKEGIDGPVADHAVRLKAAAQVYSLAGITDTEPGGSDPTRPVAVAIILSHGSSNGHAQPALQAHGVTLHLSGDDRG